jgi:aerobic carbon-monoxide dehydrogenase medium subunit
MACAARKVGARDGCILAGGQSLVLVMAFRMAATGASDRHQWDCRAGEDDSHRWCAQDRRVVWHAAFDTGALPGAAGALLRKLVRHIAHFPSERAGRFAAVPPMPIRRRNGVVL